MSKLMKLLYCDGGLLPGGVMNGDQIRMIPEARQFVEAISGDGKPIRDDLPWRLAAGASFPEHRDDGSAAMFPGKLGDPV
jgi:hypothetical protein